MSKLYEVKVENIFEGPMDILVFLIRKNEVNISDIPIALITEQYLAYLEWMETMNIDFAGDFILMASTLTHIKSKMLLPVHEEKAEDPRLEISRPLAEYLRMKLVAELLNERELLGEHIFPRGPAKADLATDREDEVIQADLFDLIEAFQKVLEKMTREQQMDFSPERFSIKDKISEITDILEKEGSITFDGLFPAKVDRSEIVVTFIAILEMAKLSLIQIAQQVQAGCLMLDAGCSMLDV